MIAEQITDLRAEFIAGSRLEDGLLPDRILFRSLGSFKRRSHLDVESVTEQEVGHFKGLVIDSNRSGLYDYLPEQLFHLPTSSSVNTLKKKVDEIRLQREKERKSRLFFLPLEQEFFQNRVALTLLEQKAFELHADSLLLEELKEFWQAPDSVSQDMLVRLLPVHPFVSENRGDMEVAGQILTSVLDLPVRIKTDFGNKINLNNESSVDGARLGMDTIFGGEVETYEPELTIEIELNTQSALESCITDPDFNDLVQWLSGWFVPAECDCRIAFKFSVESLGFWLGGEEVIASRLGYGALAFQD